MAEGPARSSDRWATPLVFVALIFAGLVVVLAVLAAVTYLTVRGADPQPIVQLTGTLVAAVGSVGTFVVGLVSRRGQARVEREAGRLATGTRSALEELERERGRHAGERGTAPAAPVGHHGQVTAQHGPSRGPSDVPADYSDTRGESLRDTAWYSQ